MTTSYEGRRHTEGPLVTSVNFSVIRLNDSMQGIHHIMSASMRYHRPLDSNAAWSDICALLKQADERSEQWKVHSKPVASSTQAEHHRHLSKNPARHDFSTWLPHFVNTTAIAAEPVRVGLFFVETELRAATVEVLHAWVMVIQDLPEELQIRRDGKRASKVLDGKKYTGRPTKRVIIWDPNALQAFRSKGHTGVTDRSDRLEGSKEAKFFASHILSRPQHRALQKYRERAAVSEVWLAGHGNHNADGDEDKCLQSSWNYVKKVGESMRLKGYYRLDHVAEHAVRLTFD